MIWYGLVLSHLVGLILLIWSGLVWSGLVQSNCYGLFSLVRYVFVSFSLFFKCYTSYHDVTYWCCFFYKYILIDLY